MGTSEDVMPTYDTFNVLAFDGTFVIVNRPSMSVVVPSLVSMTRIDQAIAALDEAAAGKVNNVGAQDFLYNGDPKKWEALAHAVKAHMWPLRLPYGNSDVVSNPNVAAAFGTGNQAGNYFFTENIWLFGGTR